MSIKFFAFRSVTFLQRYCTFQRNEPCSLPVTVEMISVSFNFQDFPFFKPWSIIRQILLFHSAEFYIYSFQAYLGKTPEEIALATTFNALKVFGLS